MTLKHGFFEITDREVFVFAACYRSLFLTTQLASCLKYISLCVIQDQNKKCHISKACDKRNECGPMLLPQYKHTYMHSVCSLNTLCCLLQTHHKSFLQDLLFTTSAALFI